MANIKLEKRFIPKEYDKSSVSYVGFSGSATSTQTDLSNYYNKTQIDASFYNKNYINTNYYTNTYIDASFYNKNYINNNFYNKTQSDDRFANVTGDIFTGDVSFNAKVYGDDIKGKSPFVSGFTGTGMQVKKEGNKYNAEFDNLVVRGGFKVYEMEIGKITANKGSQYITDAAEKADTGLLYDATKNRNYFTVDANYISFSQNDVIKSQEFTGRDISQFVYTVNEVSTNKVYVDSEPTDLNDNLGQHGYLTGEIVMSMADIDSGDFMPNNNIPYIGYNFELLNNKRIRTSKFSLKGKGKFKFHWIRYSNSYGVMYARLRDGSENIISDTATLIVGYNASGTATLTVNNASFNGGDNCYLEFYAVDSYSVGFYIDVIEDYTVKTEDVSGKGFVKVGNTVTPSSALYLTASDVNAPYIEALSDLVSSSIQPVNRKARFGHLEGLEWNGSPIGGDGLWGENVYLSGILNVNSGQIGNFIIDNGVLTGESSSGGVLLDPNTQSILLLDSSGNITVEMVNNSIDKITEIQATSEINYIAPYSTTYTNLKKYYEGLGIWNSNKIWEPTIYLKNRQTTGNTFLEASTGQRDNRYDIQANAGSEYNVNINTSIILTPVVPPNIGGDIPHEPPTIPASQGGVFMKHIYSIGGYWTVSMKTSFYAGDNTLLDSTTKTLAGQWASSKYGWPSVSNFNIKTKDASVWIKEEATLLNALYLNDAVERWIAVNDGGFWYWEEQLFYIQKIELEATFNIKPDYVKLDGSFQKTQIGKDGLLSYWDSDKYFSINKESASLFETAGNWTHKSGASQYFRISADGRTASTSYPFNLTAYRADYAAYIKNELGSSTGKGLLVQNGLGTGSTLIQFKNVSATDVGKITHNNTNTTYGTSSDARLKENIRDISINATEFIENIPVREWEWKNTNKHDVGFIAQEMLDIYPDIVQVPADPSTEMYGVGSMGLIPFLVKALQEANKRIDGLQNEINNIKETI